MRQRKSNRERLEGVLSKRLRELLGRDDLELKLYTARGYWTHHKQDVMQFTGYVRAPGLLLQIGSWDSVTKCLRNDFSIHDERDTDRRLRYAQIVIEALRKERFNWLK